MCGFFNILSFLKVGKKSLKVRNIGMVRMKGLEPSHLAAPDPKSFFNCFSLFLKSYQILSNHVFIGVE